MQQKHKNMVANVQAPAAHGLHEKVVEQRYDHPYMPRPNRSIATVQVTAVFVIWPAGLCITKLFIEVMQICARFAHIGPGRSAHKSFIKGAVSLSISRLEQKLTG